LSEKVSQNFFRSSISPSQIIYPPCVEGPRGEAASITKKGKRKEEKRKKEKRREPLALPQTPSESSESSLTILGKIRIHSIHRSRRFPKSMERDGWEIRG
jgi:hypothetical protein